MRTISPLVFCVLLASAFTSLALGASPGATPRSTAATAMAIAVAAAWERSVEFQTSRGKRDFANADEIAASYLWAAPPSLEVSRREDRGNATSRAKESEIGLALPLLLPGQRDARLAAASSGRDVAEWSKMAARLRVASEVREAAWDLAAKRAEVEIADALVVNLASLSDDVEKRIAAGDLARADGLAARAELVSAQILAIEARQKLAAATAQWRLLTGLPPITDPTEADESSRPEHPELALAAAATTDAGKRLELSRVSRSEPPELFFRVRQDSPGAGLPTQNSIGLGLRIPLGTPDRNLPREATARSAFDVARATETRLRDKIEADVQTARDAFAAARQQQHSEMTRTELLSERAALVEKSFRAGETALPELLRATLAAAQARAGYARQQAATGLAKARLQQSLGLLP